MKIHVLFITRKNSPDYPPEALLCWDEYSIVERHGARPFAFRFETHTVSDDVDDGHGGKLKVQPRRDQVSGRYYLGGTLLSQDDVLARGNEVLLSNMRSNGWGRVIESTRSYKIVQPFEADDAIVDDEGNVVIRGTDTSKA